MKDRMHRPQAAMPKPINTQPHLGRFPSSSSGQLFSMVPCDFLCFLWAAWTAHRKHAVHAISIPFSEPMAKWIHHPSTVHSELITPFTFESANIQVWNGSTSKSSISNRIFPSKPSSYWGISIDGTPHVGFQRSLHTTSIGPRPWNCHLKDSWRCNFHLPAMVMW